MSNVCNNKLEIFTKVPVSEFTEKWPNDSFILSFEKIVPIPKNIDQVYWTIENYNWRKENWGTSSDLSRYSEEDNAFIGDELTEIDHNMYESDFTTHDSPPVYFVKALYEKLVKKDSFTDIVLEYQESGVGFVGRYVINAEWIEHIHVSNLHIDFDWIHIVENWNITDESRKQLEYLWYPIISRKEFDTKYL